MSVTASAPGKLLLYGDHAVVYGHPCIVTAVDQRVKVKISGNDMGLFELQAPDLGLHDYQKPMTEVGQGEIPKPAAFIERVLQRFLSIYPPSIGLTVETQSQFSSQFGFGSSSAVTVAFAKALTMVYEINMASAALFDMCYQAVLDVQGVGSGFDLAAAIWGGTIYYVSPAQVVKPLKVGRLPVVVGYTGVKADTPTLIRQVQSLKASQPDKVNQLFGESAKIVDLAKTALLDQNWQAAGELMSQNQSLLAQLEVSSPKLDALTQAAEKAGAAGAKLSGAGGGDCMIAVVDHDHKKAVATAITQAGGTVMNVGLHAKGVRIESER